jgi:hypothetical protein
MRNLLKRGLPSSELNPRHPEEILITITLVTLNHGLESAIVDFTPESVYLQPGSLHVTAQAVSCLLAVVLLFPIGTSLVNLQVTCTSGA